jgi:cobalt-zinc-cadmium efflux system membrane fusion protein
LHDRDWVYIPVEGGRFRRLEVIAGKMLPANTAVGVPVAGAQAPPQASPAHGKNVTQEITSGLRPGQQVVANALMLQATVEQ